MSLLAIFIALLFLYSVVSARLERTGVTGPMVFTVAGMLTLLVLPELRQRSSSLEWFLRAAEVGLALLLFTEASRTDLRVLKTIRELPLRLLSVGMLLTMLLGCLGALAVFPHLTIWEAAILAIIVAPTDAGLGQVIVNSPRVPRRIRQALNVEAGLNDGLAVPFLLFFIALAGAEMGGHSASLTRFIMEQLGLGALVGVAIGLPGAWLFGLAQRHGWTSESFRQLGMVALPLLCVLASDSMEASMFIATFVAGLSVQVGYRQAHNHSLEFAEGWGQLLNLSVFFLFGVIVAGAVPQFTSAHLLYAVVSLTLVRMLPVAIALFGTRLEKSTVLFVGWFGPRGLASIVLGLVYLGHEMHLPGESTIRLAVMATVWLSIFAHGLSAKPGIGLVAGRGTART
jgi:sodium/hydrogen antiporter